MVFQNLITASILLFLWFGGINSAPPLRGPSSPAFETSQEIIPLHRLPHTVIPSRYFVELQPILDEGYGVQFTAPGKVWIDVSCRIATTNITLHALTLNITERSIKIEDLTTWAQVGVASVTVDEEKQFFVLNLASSLTVGNDYRIYIEFVAPVSREVLVGLYLSNYTATDGTTRYMTVTDLEATDARRVFPCFDEPDMKAEFDISIIRLAKYHSLANMPLVRTETDVPGLPGWVKDVYGRTEAMSTYLFCIAVSDFEMEEAGQGHYTKPVRIWGPPEYIRSGAGRYSPNVTAKLITALENYFRVPYTFPKMDKIAVPHFSGGAMENWGLNTYRLNRLLLEDGIATSLDRVRTTVTLSHELVHQWFGNLVTMRWWDDLWLNEGFASYYSNTAMVDIGLADMLPMDTLVSDEVQAAMRYDVTNSTHPIHFSVTTPQEIRIMFDTITYSKGAAIVRMTNAILTEALMKNGLTTYLTKYQHGNAHQDDLFQVLYDEAGNNLPDDLTLKDVLDTWTLQTGFPILHATRTEGTNNVIFRQERFKADVDEDAEARTWHIPISIFVPTDAQIDTRAKVWIKADEPVKFLTVIAPWFIVNPQQTGYYRVKYDPYSLSQLTEQLHRDHTVIDPQTRSGLIDDSLNLAFAGYSPLPDALNLTMYLKNERHLTPWTTFVANMAKPYRFLARTSTFASFKKYILGLVKDTLTEINLDPQPSEPISNATILRNRLFEWACNLGDSDCIQYSKQKYAEFMASSDLNAIFPDLRPLVYCSAIANGGDKEWDFALAQYRIANREVTQTNLIRSLGCSKSTFRLSRLLDLAIDPNSGIENAQRVIAMQAVAGNSVGVELAFRFIRENFETIQRRFGVTAVSSVITTLSTAWTRNLDIANLDRFITDNEAALEPVNAALQSALNAIHANVKWMATNGQPFRDFVDRI